MRTPPGNCLPNQTNSIATSQRAIEPTWRTTATTRSLIYFLYFCAGYLFVRGHLLITRSYLNLPLYIAGHERLPFQRRVLPMLLLRALLRLPLPHFLTHGANGVLATPALTWLLLIDLLAFATTVYFCVRLYRQSTNPASRSFAWLLFPILIFASSWTYVIHTEQNLYYPYDLLSGAFFTAGLSFIYARQFFPLLLVIAVGTFNRETTLLLIPLYAIDALGTLTLFRWKSLPWLRTLLLVATWCAVKYILSLHYTLNDRSEDYLRISENLRSLSLKNWPELLAGCGFLLPILWIYRNKLSEKRLTRWITFLFPVWTLAAFSYGVIRETRIYGELCAFVAVISVMLLDSYSSQHQAPTDPD